MNPKENSTLSLHKYPSRQQVIDRMEEIDIERYIEVLTDWKKNQYAHKWAAKTTNDKIAALESLVYLVYYQQPNYKEAKVIYVKIADRYALHTKTNTIILDGRRASILSTLHEIGHAIFGIPEVDACAFSIKLFARVFPNEYSRLEWHGHMLKLPK